MIKLDRWLPDSILRAYCRLTGTRRNRQWLRGLLNQGTTWPDPLTWRDLRRVIVVDKTQQDHAYRRHTHPGAQVEHREVWLFHLDLIFRRGRHLTLWEIDRYAATVTDLPSIIKTVDDMAFHASEADARRLFAEALAWADSINRPTHTP